MAVSDGDYPGCGRNHPRRPRDINLGNWVAGQPEERFEIAAVTVAALWHGVEGASASHHTKRERYLRTILGVLPVLPYTQTTALRHARIWADLESSGTMIGFYDLIVAATAVEHGSAVATFNQRHFAQVRGLKVIEND